MGWWMLWGGIMMLVFWGGIFALIAWTVQSIARQPKNGDAVARPVAPRMPMDIARERYARGEIGEEEFERIRRALAGPEQTPLTPAGRRGV